MDRVGGVLVETYRIERLIAEGSMGSVYEARHLRIPKRFAVKFLRLGLEGNAEALERFRREAEVVATLDHPNIVGLFDYNVGADGVPYIVLEYLDGEHLAARLKRTRKLPVPEAIDIVAAVGAALQVAHARDIIHRDLKPENIVLLAGGGVKVVDFGVAKLRGAPELTAVNTVVGTVPYMAPEQLMGGALDARVDQYALATIAYEMLAGEMAFDGTGAVTDVARRVLTHQPPFIADVPQALNEALFRGMARGAADRFPSVGELVAALRAAAGAAPAASSAPSSGDDELPPLDGEATRVTLPEPARDDDEDDPVAPPPDDAPAVRTAEMPALAAADAPPADDETDDYGALAPEATRAAPAPAAPRPALSPVATRIVQTPVPPARATPVPAARATPVPVTRTAWDAVAAEPTRQSAAPNRLRWMLLGVLVGAAVALGAMLALL